MQTFKKIDEKNDRRTPTAAALIFDLCRAIHYASIGRSQRKWAANIKFAALLVSNILQTYSGGPEQPGPIRAGCFTLMIG